MIKNKLRYIWGMLILIFFSCSDEVAVNREEQTPVQLSGILTRADESPRNIYVKGFFPGPFNTYFDETPATIPSGLSATDVTDIVFPGASPYYPLGEQTIRIIAYSGKAPEEMMVLTAGTDMMNDAVLSNYGKRASDAGVNRDYESAGTIGSASDPVEILQFRHVMTQVIVDYEVDPNSMVDRTPETIQFTLAGNDVITSGRYSIRAPESPAQPVTNLSTTKYTLRLGTNYLVPTGGNLAGQQMETLRIDDYVALPQDLAGYTIQPLEGATYPEMNLLPGLSYRLTLTISRLRLTGVRLQKIDWQPQVVTGDLGYDPYMLNLNLGSYVEGQDNDTISRVVLFDQGKQYVGRSVEGNLQFITLPPGNSIDSVSVYTNRGLLIHSDNSAVTYTYAEAGSTLTMPLSVGGFLTENGGPVSETNPYLVTTTVQFMNIGKELNAYYKQAVTVDLTTLNLISGERFFNGFGDFTGGYDGNGYRIDGIDIVSPGLFSSNSGTLRNLRITSGTVDGTGAAYCGSVCGVNTGDIIACVNEARIINSGQNTIQGGITGQNSGRIIGCVNTGTILQGDVAGGIAGENLNTNANTFVACINTGALNPSATYLGYICGQSSEATGVLVLRSCFGLVGSAQHVIGSPETPVGTNNVGTQDVSSDEPAILRNGLEQGQTDENQRIINKLNRALAETNPDIATAYRFVYDTPENQTDPVTGITWPAPVMNVTP